MKRVFVTGFIGREIYLLIKRWAGVTTHIAFNSLSPVLIIT